MVRSKLCGCRRRCKDGEILFFNDRCFIGDRESIAVSLVTVSPEFNPTNVSLCLSLKTIWYWSSYRRRKLSCRGKLPTRIFVLLQPFPCREIMIIDLFLVALLSLVCLVLTDSSSLVTRLTEECHRSDGERSLEWQTPAVAYPFGSLHDLCVAVVVVLLDEVVRHFRQDLSILLIICQINSLGHLFDRSGCSFGRNNR